MLQSVLQIIENESGDAYVGVATDHVIESFRNQLWADYKTGAGIERALRAQFEPLEEALAAMGVVVWPMVELEADDALASAAHLAAKDKKVEKVAIWTPDKDLAQCVRGERVVQIDGRRKIVRDAAGVREKFGVDPPLIPDLLALVGDAADGYPGIPGIGAKTAATLLNRTVRSKNSRRAFSANSVSSRCSSRNSRRCARMRRSLRRSRRCAGAGRRRPLRSGRSGWRRRGCSSVVKRRLADEGRGERKMMRAFLLAVICGFSAAGCHQPVETAQGPLPQRVYFWQRDWTPAVADALVECERRTNGVVVLGAEILWNTSGPEARRASIDWDGLKRSKTPCSVALRIAPFSGPFAADDANAEFIVTVARSLVDTAGTHGVKLEEFQIDFDCAQKNLAGYRLWLRRLRAVAMPPTRLVMTTLPAWLEEAEFRSLVGEVDGFVLQVHSVPTRREAGRAELFDPELARKWVARAAKLGRPFSVALPTYRCVAGYDENGKLLGVYMDSVPPKWPVGTTTLEFAADADAIADAVREWQRARPREMRELIWYRAPVSSDVRNWHWPTLAAVMEGRRPRHELRVAQEGKIRWTWHSLTPVKRRSRWRLMSRRRGARERWRRAMRWRVGVW